MTAENQLYLALKRIAEERGKELDESAGADVTIPLKGGDTLTVPIMLLSTAR